jgi:hypothetical protein
MTEFLDDYPGFYQVHLIICEIIRHFIPLPAGVRRTKIVRKYLLDSYSYTDAIVQPTRKKEAMPVGIPPRYPPHRMKIRKIDRHMPPHAAANDMNERTVPYAQYL